MTPPPPLLDLQLAAGGAVALPLPPLTPEDVARSADRSRVHHARRRGRRWHLLWLLVGPGILAILGENDGPSMISYAATGATYGLGFFLPFIVVTFGMAFVCQEMCMRVGAVTHRGYGQLVLQRYGRLWGSFVAGDLLFTNLVTLIAEFVSIRVGLAYFHLGSGVAAGLGLVLVLFTLSGGCYWRWERIALGLAIFNGLFLVAAVMVGPNWGTVGHAAVTFSPFPGGSFNTLLLLVASTIGATITPWMVFFQQSASADKGLTPGDVKHGRIDTIAGGALAALFGCGALIAGAALATHGGANIQGLAGAGFPGALRSVSGGAVGTVFALGLIEAGAVAVLTISAQHRLRRRRVHRHGQQLQQLPAQGRAVLRRQHHGRADRSRDHPDSGRAAAVDLAERQRARHRPAARDARVHDHAGQRPRADGQIGQQTLDQQDRSRDRGSRVGLRRRGRNRLVPSNSAPHPRLDDQRHPLRAPPPTLEPERDDEALVMFLETAQLVSDKTRPGPRAPLSPKADVALRALRLFVLIVSAMVIYTFFSQLGS